MGFKKQVFGVRCAGKTNFHQNWNSNAFGLHIYLLLMSTGALYVTCGAPEMGLHCDSPSLLEHGSGVVKSSSARDTGSIYQALVLKSIRLQTALVRQHCIKTVKLVVPRIHLLAWTCT